jgi:hypothetical protein
MGKLVADIIVETLQSAGVKHCYGIVGDTLNLIARSLEKSEIEWVSVRHEEAGMSMVKHRCHGMTAIAQLAGAIGCAHRQIFYGCRKRAFGSSADSRLVFAGAPAEFS